jgi:hypothetical protein
MNMPDSEQSERNGTQFLKQLLYLPEIHTASLSPDGKWVAFEWFRVHENMDIFLVPADGSAPPVTSRTP